MPATHRARAAVWVVLALAAALPALPSGRAGTPQLVGGPKGCALATRPGPPCECAQLPGELRRVLGLPLPLNRASPAELQLLSGIGPARARALADARPFAAVVDIERVRGIGPATRARLAPQLFVGPDPACGPGARGLATLAAL